MRITKTDEGWAIEVPADVVANLALQDGEEVEVDIRRPRAPLVGEERQAAIEKLTALAWTFPADFKFDREEANARD